MVQKASDPLEVAGPDAVVVEIRDYGTGLTDPEKAFEAFYSTKQKGWGWAWQFAGR